MAYTSSTPPLNQGFIWELNNVFNHSDLWGRGLPPDPSEKIREMAEEAGIWNEGMRPYLWKSKTNLHGCRYTPNYVNSSHMAKMANRLDSVIHLNHPDDMIYGVLYIRRGDKLSHCDTT